MFEADPLTMATFAHNAVDVAVHATASSDLPAQVPDFVGHILGEIGSTAHGAMDGLGQTISDMTPGGEAAAQASGHAQAGGHVAVNGSEVSGHAQAGSDVAMNGSGAVDGAGDAADHAADAVGDYA